MMNERLLVSSLEEILLSVARALREGSRYFMQVPFRMTINSHRFHRFLVLLRLIICHHSRGSRVPMNKRALYYREKNTFGSYGAFLLALKDVTSLVNSNHDHRHSVLINCSPTATAISPSPTTALMMNIGVVSAAKGLLFGNIRIWDSVNNRVILESSSSSSSFSSTSSTPVLIDPQLVYTLATDIHSNGVSNFILTSSFTSVLIVEKEAVFHQLIQYLRQNNAIDKFQCLLVTGKGYPDEGTRVFLSYVLPKLLRYNNLQSYILVDPNPFGLDIYCQYRYGSSSSNQNNNNNNSNNSNNNYNASNVGLILPNLKLLGIMASEMPRTTKLQSQNKPDKMKLKSIQLRSYFNSDVILQREVTHLLNSGEKGEIENIQNYPQRFFSQHTFLFSSSLSFAS